MTVVADTTPLHYLVLIEQVHVLPSLYTRTVVPQTVVEELQHKSTPTLVRAWITQPPSWLDVQPDPPADPHLQFLDPGERAALALAEILPAEGILIDDWEGRTEAQRRRLRVTGTVGVLVEAHRQGLLGFETVFTRLRATNFRLSAEVERLVRHRLSGAK